MVKSQVTALILCVMCVFALGCKRNAELGPIPDQPDMKCSRKIVDERGGAWLLVCPPDFQGLIEWEESLNEWFGKYQGQR